MNIGLQNILVLCAVLAAVGYLIRWIWRTGISKGPAGCRNCRECISPSEPECLITLDPPGKVTRP